MGPLKCTYLSMLGRSFGIGAVVGGYASQDICSDWDLQLDCGVLF